jgi:phage gp36-like protein
MAYATRTDIDQRIRQDELVRLTDEDDLGAVNDGKVEASIEAAGLEIDSFLGRRYALPLASVPPILTSLAVDLAIWNLYSVVDADGMPKTRAERRQAALGILERLADGAMTLGAADPGGTAAVFTGGDRVFTRKSTRGLL